MTKEKYPRPHVWLDIEICRNIYKAYKEIGPEAGVGVPIPDFDSRYPGALESILGSVQYKADALNYDVKKTAVYYFVSFTKSQCFLDANKRLAVIYTSFFLRSNGYRLKMNPSVLRDVAIIVSSNDSLSIPKTVNALLDVFEIEKKVLPGA